MVSRLATSCLLFALRRESLAWRRAYPPRNHVAGAPCRAYQCGPGRTVVVETGIGAIAVQRALDWLFSQPTVDQYSVVPSFMLFAGFAGGLKDSVRVGDLVLANDVIATDGKRWTTTWPGLKTADIPRGAILTSPTLLADPDAKRRLGQEHNALAVDMESAAFARICTERQIPFGCLRAISDAVSTPLSPRLVAILSSGQVSPRRLAGAVCRQPSLLRELLRLRRDTCVASQALAKGIATLLTSAGSDPKL